MNIDIEQEIKNCVESIKINIDIINNFLQNVENFGDKEKHRRVLIRVSDDLSRVEISGKNLSILGNLDSSFSSLAGITKLSTSNAMYEWKSSTHSYFKDIENTCDGLILSNNVKKISSNKIFVIQPFSSEYDEYYKNCFEPAIKDAGFTPVRIDEVPGKQIISKEIEKEINESVMCFAEISIDNPNVWYEIGMAHAKGKKIVMVSKKRDTYPFDVRHYNINEYSPDTLEELKIKIIQEIKALYQKLIK